MSTKITKPAAKKASRARLTPAQLIPTAGICIDGDATTFLVLVKTGRVPERLSVPQARERAELLRQAAANIDAQADKVLRVHGEDAAQTVLFRADTDHETPADA